LPRRFRLKNRKGPVLVKPYSEACDRNRDPILAVIRPVLAEYRSVLEIGSGTGQHAVYFAERLPHLLWHTSDREEHRAGIEMWLAEANVKNVRPPLALDVTQSPWPAVDADAVFSANTAHIMHWREVRALFAGVGGLLPEGGVFLLYGPFNYNGAYTSESNERFDGWLKSRDPLSGIRHFEDVDLLARQAGMVLREDLAMPANNRLLYWQKQAV
jgi:cyclopropane fatty-acyl-phospholipid synthase-like methyltransferase